MKVLHVIPTLQGGGAERFTAQLVDYQRQLGVDARACIFQRGAVEPAWCRCAPTPIELCYTPRPGVRGRLATIPLAEQLREVIEHEKPDIVHTHLWPACKIAARATKRVRVRHVWHVHDTPAWVTGSSVAGMLQRTQLRLMVARYKPLLLACSESARRDVVRGLRIHDGRVATIRNGVDMNQFYPMANYSIDRSGPVKMIMAAAFRPAKGHLHLVEAVELLIKQGVRFELTLAGDANSQTGDLIKCEVIRRGLTDVVQFAGQVANMVSLLREHEIFVLPSESEGLPLSMLEAMCCGLAVVATRVGGIPEVLEHGKTGLLVDPGKNAELAECLQMLITSSELRHTLGGAGAQRVARDFSFKECALRIVEAYDRRWEIGDWKWPRKKG